MHYELPHLFVLAPLPIEDAFLFSVEINSGGSRRIVPEALQGQGIAKQLVLAGLASARERGLRVIPQCPVFAAYMRAHPDTHDLLADDGRKLLGL